MKLMLAYVAVVGAAAALLAQGPVRPRPRPPGAATVPRPLPPAPRIGQEPEEEERDTFRYVPPADPLLAKAIEANIDFHAELPDFVCLERMTRSSSRDLGKKWKREDVVEAEILTIGDKVEYRDIKLDGEPTGAADMSEVGGAWSVGEYGAVVMNLFNPRSRAQFTKQGPGQVGGLEAVIYDYKIADDYSRWKIYANGKEVIPAHHGKVWIGTETGRALRVEAEATYLPHDFPMATVAAILEYTDVEIDGRRYLLPSRAENRSCQQASVNCFRMEIEFLEYRKFASESTLFTTDSDIEFGDVVTGTEAEPDK